MTRRKTAVMDEPSKKLLKQVCVIGLVLALILSWGMVIFILIWGRDLHKDPEVQESSFAVELKKFDLLDVQKQVLEGENPERIETRLSRLQKLARNAEEQLSALKRRRILAVTDRRFIPGYAKAAKEAAETFAYSSPLAATAAEAVLMDNPSLSGDSQALLRTYARRVSQNRFELLELCLYILAGDMENPDKAIGQAAGTGRLENLLSQDLSAIPAHVRKDLLIDEFLLRANKNDIAGASQKLNNLLSSSGRETNDAGLLRMGAEFFYDHNNPLRAGELFIRLGGERDLARAADALVLAGEIPGARNIWLALSSSAGTQTAAAASWQSVSRSLYNLAASSSDKAEESAWLEKLFSRQTQMQRAQSPRAQAPQTADTITKIFSVIRYTRLLDAKDSIAVLSEEDAGQNPYLDLELLRRRLETLPPTRAAAEVWLLLGRHSGDEALYEWAAWYFDHQKLYTETGQVLKEAERKEMAGPWLDLHRSLALIREGKTTEGEKILKDAYFAGTSAANWRAGRQSDWRIPANLGRIQESRRAVSAALEYYEAAAALVKERKSAAQVQVRISRCLEALGRTAESRRALEAALELDPEDINIRRAVRNFSGR